MSRKNAHALPVTYDVTRYWNCSMYEYGGHIGIQHGLPFRHHDLFNFFAVVRAGGKDFCLERVAAGSQGRGGGGREEGSSEASRWAENFQTTSGAFTALSTDTEP